MARKIYPGNFVSVQDSYDPTGLLLPPFLYYRVCGTVDISSTNTTTKFTLTIPSANNTDPNKTFPTGFRVPTGAFLLRKGFRIPTTNLDGEVATLVGTNTDKLFVGSAVSETGAHVCTAGSDKYASGGYALDALAPNALGGDADMFLWVANAAGNAAGTAPTASKGTMRLVWDVVYAMADEVITLDEIPNGYKV